MAYDAVAGFPMFALCLGLTVAGTVLAVRAARRRGIAAGAHVLAWALLPLGVYLVGAARLVWRMGSAVTTFVADFVFSPSVWLGLVVLATSAALFGVTSFRRRAARRASPSTAVGSSAPASTKETPGAGRTSAEPESGFEDIEEILRRRGIS